MDPQACLERWRDALATSDRSEARAARVDLANWLGNGGFWPQGLTKQEFAILKRYHGAVPPQAVAETIAIKRLRYLVAQSPHSLPRVRSTNPDFESHQFWTALHNGHADDYMVQLGIVTGDVVVTIGTGDTACEYSVIALPLL